jgi:predicted nucleic acid-binding Zn ribbon protein
VKRLGDDVSRELRRFGPAAGMAEVVAVWPEITGEGIARNAWPARISRDGTLHVAASSAAWAFELTQLAPTLLDRLRGALGKDAPAALRFAPGRLPDRSPGASERPPARVVEPGPGDRELAAALVSTIEDEALRDVVARAAAASLARHASGR